MLSARFKEKGPVSSLYAVRPFSDVFCGMKYLFPSRNFHFGRPRTNFSGLKSEKQKKKKKKKSSATPPVIPLGCFDLIAWATFPWVGPWLFCGGPVLEGPCQQLLTLLTLKSATLCSVHAQTTQGLTLLKQTIEKSI